MWCTEDEASKLASWPDLRVLTIASAVRTDDRGNHMVREFIVDSPLDVLGAEGVGDALGKEGRIMFSGGGVVCVITSLRTAWSRLARRALICCV